MEELLLPEIISYIFRFMSVSDRKEAALVCKKWLYASLDPYLQKNVIFKCRLQDKRYATPNVYGRKLTHISLGDENSSVISDDHLVSVLSKCTSLIHLDLSFCNSLFLSGRLLSNEEERNRLKENLSTVTELRLSCLRHMTDVTFTRLVSVLENVRSICLASNNILFSNGVQGNSSACDSPAVFNFSTFLRFVTERVSKLKQVDLSFTAINNQALEKLCNVPELCLEELVLKGCIEMTDKGIQCIAQNQSQLQVLDICNCKSVGNGRSFFRNLSNNMPQLHTLKARKCPQLGQCDVKSLAELHSLRRIDMGETLNLLEKDLIQGLCSPQQNLSVVELAYCSDISDKFVSALCQSNPRLKHLDLTSCSKITDASIHNITRNLLSLQYLCLAYCHEISDLGLLGFISDKDAPRHYFEHDHETCTCKRQKESRIFSPPKGLLKQHQSDITKAQTQLNSGEPLFKLSNLTSLKTLDLSSCAKITDLGVIQAIQFQEMQSLSLEYLPKLTDKGISHLVRCNPSLEIVSLRGCGALTDTAVNSLCTHCPRLKSLNVAQNDKLTDKSILTISQRCKRLRNLDISFCGSISCDAVMNMEKNCHTLKFQFRPHMLF